MAESIYSEILAQKERLVRNGGMPEWVSFTPEGYAELAQWFYSLVFPSLDESGLGLPSFSRIQAFLGLPILINPSQKKDVMVLMKAQDEFLYHESIRKNRKAGKIS